ncbi:MAG: hypothetical protein AAB602_02850 [Patescibacteria group bacterium]
MKIYCLCIGWLGLDVERSDFVLRLAHEMLRRGLSRKRITNRMTKDLSSSFEGTLETRREFVFVNCYLSGIRFHASLEGEWGVIEASFLVKPGDIDPQAQWWPVTANHPLLQPHDSSLN